MSGASTPQSPVRGAPGGPCTRRPGAVDTRCRCSPECISLATSARRTRETRKARGVPGTYPAAYVVARVFAALRANPDLTLAGLARAVGMPPRTLAVLVAQARSRPERSVRRATAHRLLTATRAVDVDPGALVDGTTTRRKVEALAVAGWPVTMTATAAGLSAGTLTPRNMGQVRASTRDAVHQVWLARRFTCGPRPQLRRARTQGWVPAGAWRDITNPQDTPDLAVLRGDPAWVASILRAHPDLHAALDHLDAG